MEPLKTKYFFIALILFAQQLSAQKAPKFGKMESEYLEMSVYEKDTSAEAVVLFDVGNTSFKYTQGTGFSLIFTRHTAIKILTKQGYDWADQSVATYHKGGNSENFSQLKGITYNLDGGKIVKTKLSKEVTFKEETNKFWDKHKFSLPDVREGSVIEFQYSIVSDFTFNLQSWNFQQSIPVMYSMYTTNIPEYFTYRKITQGYHPFSKNEEGERSRSIVLIDKSERGNRSSEMETSTVNYRDDTQVLVAKDIPAMRDESFVSSISNYVMKIEYELQSTKFPGSDYKDYRNSWASLNKEFLESASFGRQLDKYKFMEDDLLDLTKDIQDSLEVMSAIYDHVQRKVNWNGFYSRNSSFSIRESYLAEEGNIADINLTLVAALRSKGFKADPVLSSTRSNGIVRKNFPLSGQFNYVLASVNFQGKQYLLDAADNSIPFGYLPVRCLNGSGWAVTESGGGWVDLAPQAAYDKRYMLNMVFDGELLTGHVDSRKSAYAAFNDLKKLETNGAEDFSEKYESNDDSWKVKGFSTEATSETLAEAIDLEVSDHSEVVGNMVLINPILFEAVESNPFKMESRDYPIDFTYPRKISYLMTLEIPEDMRVEELPQSLNLALPEGGGRFIYNAQVTGNTVSISTQIQLTQPSYEAAFYPYLKQFYKSIVEKHAAQIVLTRI